MSKSSQRPKVGSTPNFNKTNNIFAVYYFVNVVLSPGKFDILRLSVILVVSIEF